MYIQMFLTKLRYAESKVDLNFKTKILNKVIKRNASALHTLFSFICFCLSVFYVRLSFIPSIFSFSECSSLTIVLFFFALTIQFFSLPLNVSLHISIVVGLFFLLLLVCSYSCLLCLLHFVNGFFCIVKRTAEASLEVMTSFIHLHNNYFIFLFVCGKPNLARDRDNQNYFAFEREYVSEVV